MQIKYHRGVTTGYWRVVIKGGPEKHGLSRWPMEFEIANNRSWGWEIHPLHDSNNPRTVNLHAAEVRLLDKALTGTSGYVTLTDLKLRLAEGIKGIDPLYLATGKEI